MRHGTKHQLVDQKNVKYMGALDMVSRPRDCIDADGHFVGYEVIEDQLKSYRDNYAITEEEYQQLMIRLHNERDNDAKGNDD